MSRERRFLAQDSDSLNKLKLRQICTYVHVFTNLKEIIKISRHIVQFVRESEVDDGFEDFEKDSDSRLTLN